MGWLLAAFLSTQAADAGTTVWRLRDARYYESNRLLPSSPAAIAGVKVGVTTGTVFAVRALNPHHPKLARTILVVGIAAGAYGATRNLTVAPPR